MNEETTTSLIDTALASGSATALDPEERRLQQLVLAIREDAPVADADFRLRMDARVAAGFPRRQAPRRASLAARIHSVTASRPQMAVLGGLASLLIGLVVVVSLRGGDAVTSSSSGSGSSTGSGESTQLQAGKPAQKSAPAATDMAAPSTAIAPAPGSPGVIEPPIGGGGGAVVGGRDRKVEQSAALTLTAPREKLGALGDQVIAVTDRYRGIVMSSSVTSATGDQASGYFDLRIPLRSLRAALRDLSQLATVESRTENAVDITASFVNARTHIQELTALRTSLLRRLANAQTDRAASAIRAQLRITNSQLDAATRSLAQLRRRANYAAVSVTLAPKTGGSTGGGIGSGARDLRDSLVDAANLSLRVLGVAIPIAILIALLWAGNAVVTRRRREAALDARL
jgi:hypothetical protein